MLKMRNLGNFNNFYNFHDVKILCEIFESHAQFLNVNFKFISRKCNSVSSFSGCFQRDKSKCVIAFPTFLENMLIKPYEKYVLQIQSILAKDDKRVNVMKKTLTMKKKYFYDFKQNIYIF